MISVEKALFFTFAMGAVIFFCRILPFLLFPNRENKGKKNAALEAALVFIEKAAPPAAMTVLAFNALAVSMKGSADARLCIQWIPILAGSAWTAGVHIWKRNALLSIFGGVIIYIVLNIFFK
jgi:branched-subunit amino acid transport protein AzlD